MEKSKITRRWLKNHFTYSWWKYLLLIVLGVMGVNLIFTTTEYRPPEEKKIELYVCNGYADTAGMQQTLWPLLLQCAPDQEELTVLNIDMVSGDIYASMQFSTYAAARQGDILLLPAGEMQRLTAEGANYAFADLTPYLESGVLDTADIDLSAGVMADENGEEGIYAIPADTLYGLLEWGNDPAQSMLGVTAYSGNEENAVKFLNLLISRCKTERPEGYVPQAGRGAAASIFN